MDKLNEILGIKCSSAESKQASTNVTVEDYEDYAEILVDLLILTHENELRKIVHTPLALYRPTDEKLRKIQQALVKVLMKYKVDISDLPQLLKQQIELTFSPLIDKAKENAVVQNELVPPTSKN